MFGDRRLAHLASIGRRLRPAFVPAQSFEPEPLGVSAVRTGHEEATLIAGLVLTFDGTRPRDRRRRHDEDLTPGEGAGTRLG